MGEEYKGGSTRRRNLDESMMQLDRGQGQGDQNIQEELDDANINVELEQGRAQGAGKLQYALLKQSAPMVHCSYIGQAARHMNVVGEDHILVVNSEHRVDVFKRGDARKVKTLDIEYMRYSLVMHNLLFIGTEEKMLYLVDALTFEILDRLMT